jgi:hypothetical protein
MSKVVCVVKSTQQTQEATKRASSTIILDVQVGSAQLQGSIGLQLRPCNLEDTSGTHYKIVDHD